MDRPRDRQTDRHRRHWLEFWTQRRIQKARRGAGSGQGARASQKKNLSLQMACFGEFWAVFLKISGTICIIIRHSKFCELVVLVPRDSRPRQTRWSQCMWNMCKLEALRQCIPPPRHVLPTSIAISVRPLSVSPNSDESGKESLYPDGNLDRDQNLPTFPENFVQIRSEVSAQSC